MGLFEQRFRDKKEELETLYLSLYGSDKLLQLEQRMKKRLLSRKSELIALDEKRIADPFWYRSPNMVGMTMYADLFAGSFLNIIEKIDYLKSLNVSYLHLMPFLKMPKTDNDGGFAVSDFLTVDPRLGSNGDLETLADALRNAGISLCMDFVMNHTSDEHEWAMRAKKGEADYISRYYCFYDRREPDEYEKTVPEVFPATAPGNFIFSPELGGWVMSSFYPYQWDINYHNADVFNDIADIAMMWANSGVDVFRLDAVPYIWKEKGTNCRNLHQVHTIIRMLRLVLETVAPSVILKGEVVMAPNELAAYFGSQEHPECHLLYAVSSMVNIWGALSSEDTRLLYSQIEDFLNLPDYCYFVNYIRCHDDIGWGFDEKREKELGIDPLLHKIYQYRFYDGEFPGSFACGELYNYSEDTLDARSCGTTASLCGLEAAIKNRSDADIELAIKRFSLLYAVVYALKGFPLINSGDEIGQLNDYDYKTDASKKSDSRYVHRSAFDWDKTVCLENSRSIPHRLTAVLKKLHDMRSSYQVFSYEANVRTWHSHNDSVFAIRRSYKDCDMLCVFNFSSKKQHVFFDYFVGEYVDVFTKKKYEPGIGVDINAYGVMFLFRS